MTHKQVFKDLDAALKQFGTYSYYDKGVDEVFDAQPIADYLKTLSAKDAGIWMKGLLAHEHGEHLLNSLPNYLDGDSTVSDQWFEEMVTTSGANY